jgi:protein disulfide-isomerase A1
MLWRGIVCMLLNISLFRQSLPAVTEVDAANHEAFKQADRVVAIAYVTETSGALVPSFSATAEKHRDDYLFGLSTDPKVIADAGVSPPALVLYRKFDDPKIEYPTSLVTSLTVEDIETFLKDNSMPLVDEVSADNYQFYAESGLPLAYLFLDPAANNREEHVANLRPLAKAHKGKLNFVWIDATKFSEHAKALNIHEPKWPAFVIQDLSEQLKYPLGQDEDATASRVAAWVQQYMAGNLKPQLKSQSAPERQDESVFTLVSNQFEDVVFDDDKDVFIEFYAPWSVSSYSAFHCFLT